MQKIFFSLVLAFTISVSIAQNGKDPVRVTDMLKIKTVGGVSMSKDGNKAVFTLTSIEPEGESKWEYKYVNQLWMVNTDGTSSPKQLTGKENSSSAVFSPDGKQIAFVRQADGRGQIFLLSLEGGEAIQLTKFKYGAGNPRWSPDGKTLTYCAERNNNFDVYTIPVDGGEEKRLTSANGLDDGPEYSHDGNYIYFNSYRTGKTQIWRMKADGSNQKQITNDQYSNWFAHPSPDGKWIVFITYLQDQGEAHPFGRDVKLRIMNLKDKSIRDLTEVFFGGQGTINVPSWSADSKHVAFVTYRVLQ